MTGCRRILAILGLVAALAAIAPGCAQPLDADGQTTNVRSTSLPGRGGDVAIGLETDPNGLDPTRNAWDPSGMQVAVALFDPLTAVAADGSVQPYLAERLDHNADYTQWDVRLRAGVTFHDGAPLDAAAAVTFARAQQASAVLGKATLDVTGVEAVDRLTVRFHMRKPWASWPVALAGQGGTIAAPSQLKDPDGTVKPVGTGPFMLVRWDIGKEMRLIRNPTYWRRDSAGVQLPYLDGVTYNVVEDGNSRTAKLQEGDLDIIRSRSVEDNRALDALGGNRGIVVDHDPGTAETSFVAFNTRKAPLDDARVRRAVAFATDRTKLAADAGCPTERLTDSLFSKAGPWYADVGFPGYDPDQARRLVREYKAATGRDVAFELQAPIDIGILQRLAESWAAVGIKATVKTIDIHKTVVMAVIGGFDALILPYFALTEPKSLHPYLHSSTIGPVGAISVNFVRLADPQLDAALDRARATRDIDTRKQAFVTVQRRLADLVPFIWLYHLEWIIATRPEVHAARNVTLPDGQAALPYTGGVFRLTETWVGR